MPSGFSKTKTSINLFFYFCERIHHQLDELYDEVIEKEPLEELKEEDPSEDEEEENMVEMEIENNPLEFEYINLKEEVDSKES